MDNSLFLPLKDVVSAIGRRITIMRPDLDGVECVFRLIPADPKNNQPSGILVTPITATVETKPCPSLAKGEGGGAEHTRNNPYAEESLDSARAT